MVLSMLSVRDASKPAISSGVNLFPMFCTKGPRMAFCMSVWVMLVVGYVCNKDSSGAVVI